MNNIIIPASWREIQSPLPGQKAFVKFNGLLVVVSEAEIDGYNWRHVSCSHKNKLPKWKELREVKDIFIGKNKRAIQVLPPEKEYVNIHNYCLHLWCNLDRDILPDFTMGTGMI